jgi:FkbM family methyltransferase
MNTASKRIQAFTNILRLTGFRDAIRFTWAYLNGAPFTDLTLRSKAHRITVRPRNSDFEVMVQTFVNKGCDVMQFAPGAKVIVDAGANIGLTALNFHWQAADAEIIAIEPEEENFSLLQKNTAKFPQIKTVQAALWPRQASVSIRRVSNRSWDFQTAENEVDTGAGEIQCQVITLEEILDRYGRIDILKLDIEGAEWNLFEQSDLSWLDRVGLVVAEFHGENKDMRLMKAIEGRNLKVIIQHEKHLLLPA